MKSAVKTIALLISFIFIQSCNSLAIAVANKSLFDVEFVYDETDSYQTCIMCFVGSGFGNDHHACIIGISLKDGILESKEIELPTSVINNSISYTITSIAHWGEYSEKPKRSNTSENLELAVERILLPNTLKEIEFSGFERFKNLKMINTPNSLKIKRISVKSGDFNDDCTSEYKDSIVKQWKSRKNGTYLSAFDNNSYNTYKWSLNECTGAGVVTHSETNTANLPIDNHGSINNTVTKADKVEISQSFYSDVNINIPQTSQSNDNIFVVIISNENYRRESKVEYALSDGKMFNEYCIKTLGIPQSNIHHVNDATLNDIRAEINWIKRVANAYNGEAKLIFYYAGHGIPDESTKSAYLLPIDGFGIDISTGYRISDLYAELSRYPSVYTLVFLDACFSGSVRSGKMLTSSRGVVIKPKADVPEGNMIVFSAATGDETAFPYKEQQHGMFTYFLLKKLQESKGAVSFGELGDYIIKNVSRRSIVYNSKSQTPTIIPSPNLTSKWEEMHF